MCGFCIPEVKLFDILFLPNTIHPQNSGRRLINKYNEKSLAHSINSIYFSGTHLSKTQFKHRWLVWLRETDAELMNCQAYRQGAYLYQRSKIRSNAVVLLRQQYASGSVKFN